MNLKPYPIPFTNITGQEYKDSGIEWLGKVPEEWEVKKLKWIARLEYGSSLSEEAREGGSVHVFGSNGIVGEHSKSITDKPVIIIGRKGSYGKISYSDVPCFPIDTTYYIDPCLTKGNIRWLYYVLSSMALDEITFDTGVPGLSREFAYGKIVPFPSKNEQTAIANFLDHKTAKIDELIKKNETLVELLKEKRQAIISHAVTKGLDPNANMKNSGVEWIGEIPQGWEVKRLKFNLQLLTEKTDRRENPVALENIESWLGEYKETESEFQGEGVAFEKGDILFGKLRPYLAKVWLAYFSGEAIGDFFVMRPSLDIDGRFAVYQILNKEFISIVDGSTFGAKMPRVSWDFMANLRLPTPHIVEQHAIADYIGRETGKIDATIQKILSQIATLKEYRQTLISNVVTGKVRVL